VCVTVTRCIVDTLQQARLMHDESLAKLSILTDATNQKISLTKHLARDCDLEVSDFLANTNKSLYSAVINQIVNYLGRVSTEVKGDKKVLFTIAIECLLSDFVLFVNKALITA